MPEGHTIHRLARQHNTAFAGQRLGVTSPQGRFAAGAARVDGVVLEHVEPYGKHLFYRFEGDLRVHIHLGLYGRVDAGALPPPEPRGALRMRLIGDATYADLRGPTACELVTPPEHAAILLRLGPDPLRPGVSPERAWRRISRSRAPIAGLLMDQSVIAGIGNVYRAELLFVHRLDPHRAGRELDGERFAVLWADLRRRMQAGVRAGSIVTTAPADRSRRTGGVRREDRFYAYRRAGLPCRWCATPIRTEPLAGRNLYWCPGCQVT